MFPAPGHATDAPQRKVTVLGTASIKVAPDEMHWTIQVSINDLTQGGAKNRHDASLTTVYMTLKVLAARLLTFKPVAFILKSVAILTRTAMPNPSIVPPR